MLFPFIYGDGSKIVFDWKERKLFVKFRNYQKTIPLEGFRICSFYYVAGSLYYRGEDVGKAEFFTENGKIVIDFMAAKNPKRSEKAQLLYRDTELLESYGFSLNTLRLKAFLDMLASLDKVVAVSRTKESIPLIAEKRGGEIFLEGLKIPYTGVSIIFENLKNYLLTGKAYNITQNLEKGKIQFRKNSLEILDHLGNRIKKEFLTPEIALKLMSVINLYGIGEK